MKYIFFSLLISVSFTGCGKRTKSKFYITLDSAYGLKGSMSGLALPAPIFFSCDEAFYTNDTVNKLITIYGKGDRDSVKLEVTYSDSTYVSGAHPYFYSYVSDSGLYFFEGETHDSLFVNSAVGQLEVAFYQCGADSVGGIVSGKITDNRYRTENIEFWFYVGRVSKNEADWLWKAN